MLDYAGSVSSVNGDGLTASATNDLVVKSCSDDAEFRDVFGEGCEYYHHTSLDASSGNSGGGGKCAH